MIDSLLIFLHDSQKTELRKNLQRDKLLKIQLLKSIITILKIQLLKTIITILKICHRRKKAMFKTIGSSLTCLKMTLTSKVIQWKLSRQTL